MIYFSAEAPDGTSTTSVTTGLYRVTASGAATQVDAEGYLPMIGFGSTLVFNGPPGIAQYDTTTSATSAVLSEPGRRRFARRNVGARLARADLFEGGVHLSSNGVGAARP